MPYSVEGTLQFCLADASRRLRLAAVRSLFLLPFRVLAVFTVLLRVLGLLARRLPRLARTQSPEQLETEPRQSQLLDHVRHRGLLQIADHLARYQQSRQLLGKGGRFFRSNVLTVRARAQQPLFFFEKNASEFSHLFEPLLILKIKGDVKQRQERVDELKLKHETTVAHYGSDADPQRAR